jgi:hypothetical protein
VDEFVSKHSSSRSSVTNHRYAVISDISRLARRQGGHVTRAQLIELGLSSQSIDRRSMTGSLIRVHRGVYAVGHLPTNPVDTARGALLAAGDRAALMGRSAASLWELYRDWVLPLELISPLRSRLPELVTRNCRTLLARDVRTHRGVRVTSAARTLLDLAPRIERRALDRFHNELRMRRLLDDGQLIDVAERNGRHAGASIILGLAGAAQKEPMRSALEDEWPGFAAAHGLPAYEMNVLVAGHRVDVLFTPARLVVELDGWGTHGTAHAYERDRKQDAEILDQTGIPTVRITHRAFTRDPQAQAARLLRVLRHRP